MSSARHLTKADALEHLQRVSDEIPELIESGGRFSFADPPNFVKWKRSAEICLKNIFPGDKTRLEDLDRCLAKRIGAKYPGRLDFEYLQDYVEALQCAASLLESMIEEVERYWDDTDQLSQSNSQGDKQPKSNKVFVIHGRDNNLKNEVKALLTEVGLKPIILSEQPSEGQTIIEKFEQHADVGFAVALLTPDDLGSKIDEREQTFRARQNVIFELGFFVGKLGRKHVCALTKDPNIEIPSDYSGVIYIDLSQAPAWKNELVRELRHAGLNADANNLL